MNNRPYLILGWILAALSIAALLLYPYLPERHWNLYERSQFARFLVTDELKGGGSQAAWEGDTRRHYICTILPQIQNPFCAMQIKLVDNEIGLGKDLSRFTSLRLKVGYKGPGHVLRVHMRVFDERISKPNQMETAKFQSYVFTPSVETQSITLPFQGFSVADWWVKEFAHRRDLAQLDFSNVLLIGIDIPAPIPPGMHKIQLDEIEFIGPWFTFEELLTWLILAWCLIAINFLALGWWQTKALWKAEYPAWRELEQRLGGYKPTASFRPFTSFRDSSTQCLDHTGLILALVELLHQNVRAKVPFVILELVYSPQPGSFNLGAISEDNQVEFAERLKRYTHDETGVVVRWSGPCFIVLGTTRAEQLMARLALLRAALHINPLCQSGQPLPADMVIASGAITDLEQAYDNLFSAWWRLQWRKRTGLVGVKPEAERG